MKTDMDTATKFFYRHAGWSVQPGETEEEGHRRTAETLAAAEQWAIERGITFTWDSDWTVGSHREFFHPDYPEPKTCEQVVAILDGEQVASLGCVDDATFEYRRVIEAEVAAEAREFVENELPRRKLIDAAEGLLWALRTFNEWGDKVDTRVATQTDGCPYGEVHDGLKALVEILWPHSAGILDRVFDGADTISDAVVDSLLDEN